MGEHLSSDSPAARARSVNARGDGERLRADLLQFATQMLAAPRGVEIPSLRAVARAAGVTPSAVYLHFDSGEDLARQVIAGHFADLRAHLRAVDDVFASGERRLLAISAALAAWAQERPGAYQVLFESPDLSSPEDGPGIDLLDLLTDLIADLDVESADARRRALLLWSAVHGVISLHLHKPDAPWVGSIDDDVEDVVRAIVRSATGTGGASGR